MTRPAEEVERVLSLSARGLNSIQIGRATGIPSGTIRMWTHGRTPRRAHVNRPMCPRCGPFHECRPGITAYAYAYLLGLYLGDGLISLGPRSVYKLRIFLDRSYPVIVAECEAAMSLTLPSSKVGIYPQRGEWMVEVVSHSKHWPCLFPQHGPGAKHNRRITLSAWQRHIAERYPGRLLRGLIHSDGCRVINVIRHPKKTYRYPRYFFSNRSPGILLIFREACDRLGIEWRHDGPYDVSVARRASVELLDRHVGPKR